MFLRHRICLLIAGPALLWLTWGRGPVVEEPEADDPHITIAREQLPDRATMARYLGPFRLEGAWVMRSSNVRFFGYSSLVPLEGGRQLQAFSDSGDVLSFAPPGEPARPAAVWPLPLQERARGKADKDVESSSRDPVSGRYWFGLEGSNTIVRFSRAFHETGRVAPRGMAAWDTNTGAEAMARLHDGRFVVIREVTPSWSEARLHDALLFSGDPVQHPDAAPFRFDGPDNFSVVDMTVLPDGRALILMRRLLWPYPMRFAGRIVIADTARIRPGGVWHSIPLASLASVLPVDNFEAITAMPGKDGRLTVWIMSDDNHMRDLQRTLLWKMSVDPARLPWPK